MTCTWYTATAAAICVFACTGCTWRIQLVPPPVQIVPVEDTECRTMVNAIYRCLPDAERRCVDARQALQEKGP